MRNKKLFSALALMLMLVLTSGLLASCKKATLTSIEIDKETVQTVWFVGDEVDLDDFADIQANATYSDGKIKPIATEDLEITLFSTETAGEKDLVVTYKEKTDTIKIDVQEVALASIAVKPNTLQTEWFVGDELDFSQLKVIATYNNSTTVEVAFKDVSLSEVSSEQEGVQNLVITYQDKTTTVALTIESASPEDIVSFKIVEDSIRTEWFVGDELDFTSIIAEIELVSGSTQNRYFASLQLSPINSNEAGIKPLTVTFLGKTDSIDITFVAVTPQSMVVDSSSYQNEWNLGDDLNFENIKAQITFNNGSKTTATFADLNLSNISSDEDGVKNLIVSFGTVSQNVQITIVEKQIDLFETPEFVTKYQTNIATKQNKETEFYVRNDHYYVGSQNPFIFLPKMTFFDDENEKIEIITKFMSIIEVYHIVSGTPVLLTGNNLTNYVAVSNINSSYQFTKQAEGEVFKIKVKAKNYAEFGAIEFTFKVVDGWNTYTAADLSRLDNVNSTAGHLNGKGVWDDYKAFHNIDNTKINGIILHSDIKVGKNDIPVGYTYQAGDSDLPTEAGGGDPHNIIGSLRDHSGFAMLYKRDVEKDENFTWNGNYFTVDTKEIPKVKRNYWGSIFGEDDMVKTVDNSSGTHSRIFSLGRTSGNVLVKNITFIGNSGRSESFLDAGGIMLIHSAADSFEMDNTITRNAYSVLIPVGKFETDATEAYNLFTIKNSKGYNSYSQAFFLWGAKMNVLNSEFKNSGGPMFVQMHVTSEGDKHNKGAHLNMVNTVVENFVSGDEAYFVVNNQTELVSQLKPLAIGLNQYAQVVGATKRVIEERADIEMFNLVSAIMFDDEAKGEGVAVKGSLKMNIDGVTNRVGLDFEDPNVLAVKTDTNGLAPIIQSSGGGLGYFNGSAFIDAAKGEQLPPSFFAGDTMNLYYGNVGLVLNFFN